MSGRVAPGGPYQLTFPRKGATVADKAHFLLPQRPVFGGWLSSDGIERVGRCQRKDT